VSGAFIVLEGPEGGGKTSQTRILAARLTSAGYPTVYTREPGGTQLGTTIRDIVLPATDIPISAHSEVLLYCASRAQLLKEVVRPALEQGQVVVSDRYGYSTVAYQGYGRELNVPSVEGVVRFATGGLEPDICILLDLPPRVGLERKHGLLLAGSVEEWNRFEQEEIAFHQRVREGYLAMARSDPARWVVLDASLPFEALQDRITAEVFTLLDRKRVLQRPA
jgi:dTMP kinase